MAYCSDRMPCPRSKVDDITPCPYPILELCGSVAQSGFSFWIGGMLVREAHQEISFETLLITHKPVTKGTYKRKSMIFDEFLNLGYILASKLTENHRSSFEFPSHKLPRNKNPATFIAAAPTDANRIVLLIVLYTLAVTGPRKLNQWFMQSFTISYLTIGRSDAFPFNNVSYLYLKANYFGFLFAKFYD